MAEILLLNPKGRTNMAKRRRSPAQRAATRKMLAANKRRSPRRARRANPAPRRSVTVRRARRRNPALRAYRRRRNPIGGLRMSGIMGTLKEAAVQGAGAVAMDWIFGKVNAYLPASMQRTPGQIGVGDAVRMLLTIVIGKALAKPTRGLSNKAAIGSLTVQFRDITAGLLPAGTLSGVGYAVPGRIANFSNRVGPNRARMAAYVGAGNSPLLNAYTSPGVTPLLSGSAAAREGVRFR